MIDSLVVREPSEKEFQEIAQFSFEHYVSETARSSGKSIEELKKALGGPPTTRRSSDHWLLVEQENQRIGFVWFKVHPQKNHAFGMDIYLEPEFRSKGIGRHVMNLCGNRLREVGVQSVKICVFEGNQIARSLYKSLGFETENFDESQRQFTLSMDL